MQYIHNESILIMKNISKEGLAITYRLFENVKESQTSYSVLVSLCCENGCEEDYYIPELSESRMAAHVLFEKLCENAVLPCEVEEIYSDGFSEIL